MARPKKNIETNTDDLISQLMEAITDTYLNPPENTADENGRMYLNLLAEEFSMTPIKVRKLLISSGVYQTDISKKINELYKSGKTIKEIQEIVGLSAASVSGYLPYQKTVYNLEVDTDLFIPQDTTALRAQMGLQNKQVLLCVASGWSKAKGLDTVLRLAERLTKEQILLLVGNAPQEQLTDLQIRHIPATNDTKELAALYSMADVFVQPSLEETFGKVTAEALSCGTPVVCFDSTANPELVGEGCGTVVPVGDVQAMNNAIQQILKQGKEAFSPNCRNYAVEHFQKGKNLKEYLNLFETLCKY